MLALAYLISAFLEVSVVQAKLAQQTFISNNKPYDVQVCISSLTASIRLTQDTPQQAHRGGRGNTVESTLPSFAWYA